MGKKTEQFLTLGLYDFLLVLFISTVDFTREYVRHEKAKLKRLCSCCQQHRLGVYVGFNCSCSSLIRPLFARIPSNVGKKAEQYLMRALEEFLRVLFISTIDFIREYVKHKKAKLKCLSPRYHRPFFSFYTYM